MAAIGNIVFVPFLAEGDAENKVRPALVLEDLGGDRYVLAYGSSQQVDAFSPPKGEVIISDVDDMMDCGLNRATRFDLSVRTTMYLGRNQRIAGELPKHKYGQLYRAAVHNGLLKAS